MGWWRANEDGKLVPGSRSNLIPDRYHYPSDILVWGDDVADVFDNAVDEIKDKFLQAWGRKPLRAELVSGLLFCLGSYEGDPSD